MDFIKLVLKTFNIPASIKDYKRKTNLSYRKGILKINEKHTITLRVTYI